MDSILKGYFEIAQINQILLIFLQSEHSTKKTPEESIQHHLAKIRRKDLEFSHS
jgi:hypothetical protein